MISCYGAWITTEGTLIEVRDNYCHDHFALGQSHYQSFQAGWIRIVFEAGGTSIQAEFSEANVSLAAFRELVRLWRDGGYTGLNVYFDDKVNDFVNDEMSNPEALNKLREFRQRLIVRDEEAAASQPLTRLYAST